MMTKVRERLAVCKETIQELDIERFNLNPTFSLDNGLTDGGKVVSLTSRPPFIPKEDSWYTFLIEAESTPGPQCG
jgi:hypothetical protein